MTDILINDSASAIPITLLTKDTLPGWLDGQPGRVKAWVEAQGFKANAHQTLLVPGEDGALERILLGVDAQADDASPWPFAGLPTALPAGDYRLDGDLTSVQATAAMIGWGLGAYRFDRYKKPSDDKPLPRLAIPSDADDAYARAAIDAACLVRDLVNTPANDMGPAELADAARTLADRFGASCHEVAGKDLLTQNFPAIYEVGKGSARAPRLIDLAWGDDAHPKVTLVGKGVVFDTGGYNLKPGNGMALMKKDMGGAAHVLGLAQMVMALCLPVRLRVLIPAVENSVSGTAFRPSDVINTHKGLTVEIGNTDAEGRLVLCDALALASQENPDLMVDFATLTGAARSALGPDVPPFFTDGDGLAREIETAARTTADSLWRMPLWDGYDAKLNSKVADMRNDGGMFAGAITAALFLRRFVDAPDKWVHFDIYAWNPETRPGRAIGGEAMGLRAMFEVIRQRYGDGA